MPWLTCKLILEVSHVWFPLQTTKINLRCVCVCVCVCVCFIHIWCDFVCIAFLFYVCVTIPITVPTMGHWGDHLLHLRLTACDPVVYHEGHLGWTIPWDSHGRRWPRGIPLPMALHKITYNVPPCVFFLGVNNIFGDVRTIFLAIFIKVWTMWARYFGNTISHICW